MIRLVQLYNSTFNMEVLGYQGVMLLFLAGCALGLGGAQLAVNRQLRDIEPN